MTPSILENTGEFSETHQQIIDVLKEGRGTPRYISEHVGESPEYVGKLLRDLTMAGYVEKVDRGLYELNDGALEDNG